MKQDYNESFFYDDSLTFNRSQANGNNMKFVLK